MHFRATNSPLQDLINSHTLYLVTFFYILFNLEQFLNLLLSLLILKFLDGTGILLYRLSQFGFA